MTDDAAGAAGSVIVIVEDDPNIATLIAEYLQAAGFATEIAQDGIAGLQLIRRVEPQLVILDLMLPGLDGREICRELRKDSTVPILMLTALEDEVDRVVGFSLGADDYVVKPFSPRELVERVKAILRRVNQPATPIDRLAHDQLVVEPEKHRATLAGEELTLTPSEFKLLVGMMRSPGRVFSRDALIRFLYQKGEIVIDRVVDVHIGKLRQKIEIDPSDPRYVLTVHGVGYRFADR